MQQKVSVRFKINPKLYDFVCEFEVKKGDHVVVETSMGLAIAIVEHVEEYKTENNLLKKVIRVATKKDFAQHEKNLEKEKEALQQTKALAEKFKLDMNVVNAEYTFDGSKVVVDFISEERVDFRDLVKELASKLKARIELRQIGIRDQAKMVGGIGICGRVCCCASHLKDFEKVSIKMAKVQGLALNPTKISGSCGRLMCCLEYENEYYNDVYPRLPKINSEVLTKEGKGTVISTNALTQLVSVRIEAKDGGVSIKDFKIDDVKKIAVENNQQKKQEKKN
ncbi:MAG: stage 0 sporulation protein [Clostridia bacterium]|nr:stage 0 sporulation protein [Clostridia bacterium]